MRAGVIRTAIVAVLLAASWFAGGQWWSLMIDTVYVVPLASLPTSAIGWNGTSLQFGAGQEGKLGPAGWNGPELLKGAHILGLAGPYYTAPASLASGADGRLVLTTGQQSFVLGSRAGTVTSSDGDIPAFAPDPGDQASLTIERSLLSWPTPFEMNFMTGNSPSWRRSLYYHLRWRKASSAELTMLWRFDQGYDAQNGWRAPEEREGETGLIRVEISPGP